VLTGLIRRSRGGMQQPQEEIRAEQELQRALDRVPNNDQDT